MSNITENINDYIDRIIFENNGELYMELHKVALKDVVPFPSMIINVASIDVSDSDIIQKIAANYKYVYLVTENDSEEKTGVLANIKQFAKISNLTCTVTFECICRMRKIRTLSNDRASYPLILAEPVYEKPFDRLSGSKYEAYRRMLLDSLRTYADTDGTFDKKILLKAEATKDIGVLSDFIANNTGIAKETKLVLLNEVDSEKRAEALIAALKDETSINEHREVLANKVKRQLLSEQKEHFIREQIRQLKAEINDGGDDIVSEYYDSVSAIPAPKDVKEDLLDEVSRLYSIPESSQEFSVITSYLDVVLSLPWGKYSDDNIDLNKAAKILEKDHYGLKKVKDRILETLAVKKLTGKNSGQIICLVGPPGVGKTSIAESIARACGRAFQRIALGGVKDESEIRGHRRTYIASMPGQIIEAMIHSKTMNPVILLDEVDKLGNDYKGDPTSALLEVLDPEQNKTFKDHFLNFPFDLSDVLFITTANVESNIPEPLLDRMDVIELSSYTATEKFNIAKKYLVRKQMAKNGLNSSKIRISDTAIDSMLKFYTREAGVRKLEKSIATVMRKAAKTVACDEVTGRIAVTASNIEKYLGPRKFKEDDTDRSDKVGVVNGLAYTAVGGEIMQLEVKAFDGTGKIELTGMLGDVMKESARTAVSYIRSIADVYGIDKEFYKKKDVHYHFPEGAVPKDGPSAGIGIALALISELTGRKVRGDVAMTGEITLRGNVLPIGGLREKTMAAYKASMKKVLIPKDNVSDIAELEDEVKNALIFVPVSKMDEVLAEALLPMEN